MEENRCTAGNISQFLYCSLVPPFIQGINHVCSLLGNVFKVFTAGGVISWKQTPVKKHVVNGFNRTPCRGEIERGRALAMGAWRRSRWMRGSWVVGYKGRRGSSIWRTLGVDRNPEKKATPSGTEVGALVWKRSSGRRLTLSLLFLANAAVVVVVLGAHTAVGAG